MRKAGLDLQGEIYFSGSAIRELRLGESALAANAGRFPSIELDASFALSLGGDALVLENRGDPAQNPTAISQDEVEAGDCGRLVFERTSQRRVSGFGIFTQDARGIEFQKTN